MKRRVTAMAALTALGVSAFVALPSAAAEDAGPTDLLITEYVEGSSNNKAIELYNGTEAAVDLSEYTVEMYFNASTTAGTRIALSGTLAPGATWVIADNDSSEPLLALADATSTASFFNGNDAVALTKADAVVDSIGQIAQNVDDWGANMTLQRLPGVCTGDTDATDVFDRTVEWAEPLPQNTFSGLGSHELECGDGPVEDAAPSVASTVPADGAQYVSASTAVTVTMSEPVSADGAFTLECVEGGPVAAEVTGGPTEFVVTPEAPLPLGDTCTLTVSAASVTDLDEVDPPDAMLADAVVTFSVAQGATPIGAVQGVGDDGAMSGPVVIEGIVVGDYEGPSPNLRGFYVQSRDGEHDDNPETSEGVFVFNWNNDSVALGDEVSVAGTAGEFEGQTQISSVTDITVLSSGNSVTPAAVSLPFADAETAERYEGMSVEFDQDLYVTELYLLGRFGEITVSSGARLDQPTTVAEPGEQARAIQAANDLNRVKIDDALNNQNPDPIILGGGGEPLSADNTLRGGDSVAGLTGVMTYTWAGNSASGNAWRVRPASPAAPAPVFESNNPRPAQAPDVGGDVKVASFNVLNYFLTLDAGGNECGPVGDQDDCRGANTELELDRQTVKLVAALEELDADVIGVMEMENTTGVEPLEYLAGELNAAIGEDRYSYVDTGTVGTDVIRVGMLYDTTAVSLAGEHAVLDSSVDPRFDDSRNRPAVAQTFEEIATGEQFTVVVNHWKSKGSCPDGGPDADGGDGAGCWNESRTLAAQAVVDWAAAGPTAEADDDVIIMGDLNSYAQEDPIDVLREAGYQDLAEDYSYVFDGQWGSLDYAFGSPSLVEQVAGSAHLHINADEPSALDYNTDFKSAGHVESLFAPDMYRTSDHDPVLIGLDLGGDEPPVEQCEVTSTVHGQWPGGFISQVWLTNTGADAWAEWDVSWQFTAGEQITQLWSGEGSQDGADVTVTNAPWNGTVAPGQSVTFGYLGAAPAGAGAIDAITVNGGRCAPAAQ